MADPRWQEGYRSLDLFGPRRCMVGSNFPVERLAGGLDEVYRIMVASLGGLSEPDRSEVLAGTAHRFYRTSSGPGSVTPA